MRHTMLPQAPKTKIVRPMRWIAALIALVLGYVPTALAQSSEWVVVPTSAAQDTSWMESTVSIMGDALSRRGVQVMPPEQAATLFEQQGSAPSTLVTDSDVQQWVNRSREAIRHLARGDYATALKELKEAQVLSRKAADELNRVQNRSQNVLDTCLYMVRALLETGNRARAKAQVEECVRLVPRGEPSQHMHPPNVVSLYKEASRPGPAQTGALVVNSDPSDCEVRINGLRFGQTPFEMNDLYPGEYQVQVECDPGRRGRVHPVTVRSGKTEVFVDVQFDRVVRTEPLLRLQYADKPKPDRRARDAQEVAKVLRAGAVVLATVPSTDIMELQLVGGTERRTGRVRIPTTLSGPTAEIASASAAALANGECTDFTGPKPVAIDCKTAQAASPKAPRATKQKDAPTDWPADRPPRGQWIAGLTLVSVGGATLLTGYGLLIARRGAGDSLLADFNPNLDDTRNDQLKWTNLGNALPLFGAAGGALTVAAMPLVLPYRSKTPWWAWLSGGLGVGAAVGAIVSGVTAEAAPADSNNCQRLLVPESAQSCVDRDRSIDRAIMLATTAAPLLTMPLVYLFRKGEKKHVSGLTPNLAIGLNGGYVSVGGAF